MRKVFAVLFLFYLVVSRVCAQSSYPIYVSPNLTPPYSLKLSDYSKFGSQQLVVNIAVNDLSVSNLPVKLHIKLETVGVTIENIPNLSTTPIYLDGGAASMLFGDDLKDYFDINNLVFKGYSKEAYRRTGQLPEGFYKITVEVRHFQTNRLISNRGTASAWIVMGKPPLLKLPENNKELGEFKGMPLVFSWFPINLGSPVSAGSVQYKFEMWELRVEGVSPYTVAATVPTFYEETTQNTMLSVLPASMLMTPGMKYAWRVTASDVSGFVPFEQDGHSEIRVFTYRSKCETAKNLKSKLRGVNGFFAWEPARNHTSYNVELRKPETGWLSASETFDNKAEFFDLDYGTTYELRVQSVCDNDPEMVSDFTDWVKLQTLEKRTKPDSTTCPGCGCGTPDGTGSIENLTVRKDLKPGDTLVNRFGTTRYILKSVEQTGDGVYKGQFYFWAEIWKLKFICEYWDLSANTDKVILNMDFQSVYNPQFLLDVDATTDYLNGLADALAVLTSNAKITDTLSINETVLSYYVSDDGELIAVTVGSNGEYKEIVVKDDVDDVEEILIKGANGEECVVTKNGEVMGPKEYKRTGGGNGRLIEKYIAENEKNNLSPDVQVNFSASQNQKYGFDAFTSEKETIKTKYPALGNGYIPAYKSVASFTIDKVVPNSTGNGITFRDQMGISAIKSGDELTIRGGSDGTVTALYAYNAINDTTEKIAGKLNLMSFDEQAKKLYIVPVNGANLPNETELQNVLNKIYAQAVTRWEVVKINKSVDVPFPNGQMVHGGSSAIAVYNDDQKAVISKFKEIDNFERDAYYLFFVDNVKGKTGDVAGFMPLQRQVGFIYDSPNMFVIAHELAHGTFNLRHTFSPEDLIAAENTTQNLMDYKGGSELWKHQWELIRDPENMLFAFAQDEKEGEMIKLSNLKQLEKFINPDKKSFTFISASGKYITIPFDADYVIFRTGERWESSKFKLSAFGTLSQFSIKNKVFIAKADLESNKFLYYESVDNEKYCDTLTKLVKPEKAIVAYPCFENGNISFIAYQKDLLFISEQEYNANYYSQGTLVPFNFLLEFFWKGRQNREEIRLDATHNLSKEALEYLEWRKDFATCDNQLSLYVFANAQQITYNPGTYYACDFRDDVSTSNLKFQRTSIDNIYQDKALPNPIEDYYNEIQKWSEGLDIFKKRSEALTLFQAFNFIDDRDELIKICKELAPYSCVWEGMIYKDRLHAIKMFLEGAVKGENENIFNLLFHTTPIGNDRAELLKELTDNNNHLLNLAYTKLNFGSLDNFIGTLTDWAIQLNYSEAEGLKSIRRIPSIPNGPIIPDNLFIWNNDVFDKNISRNSDGLYVWYSADLKGYVAHSPFELVKVEFDANCIGGIIKGQEMIVPVIWVYRFKENMETEQLLTSVRILVDAAVIVSTLGTATSVVAAIEIGLAGTDIFIQSTHNDLIASYGADAESLLSAWDKLYTVSGITLGLRQVTISAGKFKFSFPSFDKLYTNFKNLGVEVKSSAKESILSIANSLNKIRPANWEAAYVKLIDLTKSFELQNLQTIAKTITLEVKDFSKVVVFNTLFNYQIAKYELRNASHFLSEIKWLPAELANSANIQVVEKVGPISYEGRLSKVVDNDYLEVVFVQNGYYVRELAKTGGAIDDALATVLKTHPNRAKLGLELSEIDDFKSLLNTKMPNNASEIFNGLRSHLDAGTSFENMQQMISGLKNNWGNFSDGSKWVFNYTSSSKGLSLFGGKKIRFELPTETELGLRRIDIADVTDPAKTILYEFKSVKEPFNSTYAIQFAKDLENASGLDKIHWMYDGAKNPVLDKSQILNLIEKVDIPQTTINKYFNDGLIHSKSELIDLIDGEFNNIFKVISL